MCTRILYTSFPRSGTIWTEQVLKNYFDRINFNYSITSHHGMWTVYPMNLASSTAPSIVDTTGICFHKRRRDHKRVMFSNLERIKVETKLKGSNATDVDILVNIFDVYVQYYTIWKAYNKYLDVHFIYHEDMLEQKEDYLGSILEKSGIDLNKDKLKKSFDKYSTKKAVSKVHIERQGINLGNHMVQYLEPDYEERYEKFLDEWGDIINNRLKRFEIAS